MYRVFYNKRIFKAVNFSEDLLNYTADDNIISSQIFDNTVDKIEEWLNDDNKKDMEINNVNNDILAAAIKKIFNLTPAAGGLVLIDNKIVAIERNGIPDLPKGHVETGESPETAAVREVMEETAITDLTIIKELPCTWHCYLLNNKWILKKTSWFLMSTSAEFKPVPQTEEGISKVYFIDKNNVNYFLNNTFASIRFSLEKEILNLLKK